MPSKIAPVVRPEPEIGLAIAKARIAWALDHPGISDWLKAALRTANDLDPVAVENDVEMLRFLITGRATAEIAVSMRHIGIVPEHDAP